MKDIGKIIGKKLLFFDGAMGTALQEAGLPSGTLPEIWNLTEAEKVFEIHKSYIEAGCDIIETNTFGANRFKLEGTGFSVGEVVSRGVKTALEAARVCDGGVYTALDIGPTGKLLKPFGNLSFDEAYEAFAEMVISGAEAGADIIYAVTMTDVYEAKAAILAAKENCGLPVFVTFSFDAYGRLLTGGDILTAVSVAEGLGASAVGLNCGLGAAESLVLLKEAVKYSGIPVIINPNAGMPEIINGKTVFNSGAEEFAEYMREAVKIGASLIGGCCGTTPAHIKKTVERCAGMKIERQEKKIGTVVTSYSKNVIFGKKAVIIGERLNPTGKPRLKQALLERDFDYICGEALAQTENGAQILDVNAGIPGVEQAPLMENVIFALQSVTDAPLQIDTLDPAAAERALRIYNGKPLLNSVNGKRESLDTVLPLVKKYGAAVIALTLDENGIPETVSERIKIAEKILTEAAAYGINKSDIIIDPLTMTAAADGRNAFLTLEAAGYIKNKLGLETVLGVSNISFGLPEREKLNAAFFTLALEKGLSAAIINPSSVPMREAYYAFNALNGSDAGCAEYTEKMTCSARKTAEPVPETTLSRAIIKGLREQAEKCAEILSAELSPFEIINAHIIPSLNEAGEKFEKKEIFLPGLLMSAEAAKSAFEVIKKHMAASGGTQKKRGKILLATVKGDVHDIGKNILKTLLENYNYEIIDLGKDVEPIYAAETTAAEKIRLAGLSALMTTTVENMEATIKLIREKAPECKIMVGGAVLTKEYAEKAGADFYSADAMGGVRYANSVFGQE